jgi:hypothetical protein
MTWWPTASSAVLVPGSGNPSPVPGAVMMVVGAIVLTWIAFWAVRKSRKQILAGQKAIGQKAGRIGLTVLVLAVWAAAGYLVATA